MNDDESWSPEVDLLLVQKRGSGGQEITLINLMTKIQTEGLMSGVLPSITCHYVYFSFSSLLFLFFITQIFEPFIFEETIQGQLLVTRVEGEKV